MWQKQAVARGPPRTVLRAPRANRYNRAVADGKILQGASLQAPTDSATPSACSSSSYPEGLARPSEGRQGGEQRVVPSQASQYPRPKGPVGTGYAAQAAARSRMHRRSPLPHPQAQATAQQGTPPQAQPKAKGPSLGGTPSVASPVASEPSSGHLMVPA
ncbi:hypothetical protein WJX72_006060 [[Myrmecia] bisecta]|uniref:Uncharacterized protein n=1 Tax=[Myrmecia] bisecta TaxID=41462 RepID=A0AAW1P794_9CHLO